MKYALLSILITMSSVRVTMPLYSYGVRSDSVCPISDYSGEELRENYHVIAVLRYTQCDSAIRSRTLYIYFLWFLLVNFRSFFM